MGETYQSSDLFAHILKFVGLPLQFLDKLFMNFNFFLVLVGYNLNLVCFLFIFFVKLHVVLCQRPKRLPTGCLDLEWFKFLKRISLVHALQNGIHVPNHFFP